MRLIRRIVKGLAVLAALVVLGICMLLAALWLEHRTTVTFPTPTGPFAVGRAIYDWVDDKQAETLAPVPGTKRELLVWIWYPAVSGQSAVAMDFYVPVAQRAPAPPGDPSFNWIQRLLIRFFQLLTRDSTNVRSHTSRNTDPSPEQRWYPVVILRGGASSGVLNYSTLAEDLASHGYVVVGFDAAYRTGRVVFPDGRVIGRPSQNNPELMVGRPDQADRLNKLFAAWLADIGFVLDRLERLNASDDSGRFTGRLDMTRVGVFGHSFGGAQAAQFCHDDSRCKAGIDVDGAPFGGVIHAGIPRPFMFLLSDHGRSSDPESRRIQADIQSIYDRLPPDKRVRVAIRGANHFLFSDDGALFKSRILLRILRVVGRVGIDGRRQLAVTVYCVHTFFDAYLKGTGVSRFEISSPQYPEIQVLE